jgi:hypothetical protein
VALVARQNLAADLQRIHSVLDTRQTSANRR